MGFLLAARLRSAFAAICLAGGCLCASSIHAEVDQTADEHGGVRSTRSDTQEFDWAKVQVRARVAFVNSGPRMVAVRMIDNDTQTVFRFPGSNPHPTVIVELAEPRLLHRVSTLFQTGKAHLDMYLLTELPKNPEDLRSIQPLATTENPAEPGKVSADFPPTGVRYIALRWTRDPSQDAFEVAEIRAFSLEPTPGSMASFVSLPGALAGPPEIAIASP